MNSGLPVYRFSMAFDRSVANKPATGAMYDCHDFSSRLPACLIAQSTSSPASQPSWLFSIALWHHFVYMIVSLALLGYGASGTFLVFAKRHLLPRFHASFAALAASFGIAAISCYALARRVPSLEENTLTICVCVTCADWPIFSRSGFARLVICARSSTRR